MKYLILKICLVITVLFTLAGCLGEENTQTEQSEELLAEKEEKIAQLENEITQRDEIIESLQEQIKTIDLVQKNFFVVKGDTFSLQQDIDETELYETLGQPLSEQTREVQGGTFNGSLIKELKFDGIDLVLFSPNRENDKESFWIYEMNIDDDQFKTIRGIKVGDHVEKLKRMYPKISLAKDGKSVENNGVYEINHEFNHLRFIVEDGEIMYIQLLHEIP